MSTKLLPNAFLPHVSLIPSPVFYTNYRSHPIMWWQRQMRSIRCEVDVDPCTKLLKAEYINRSTDKSFKNKKAAENFLGQEIPESEHVGKLYTEKVREVFTYYICKNCLKIGSPKTEIVFIGPFDIVTGSINTTTRRACPNCNKVNVDIDVSTEPSPIINTGQDCDLAR